MFDKLKQGKDLLKMRSQLMDMQKQLKAITHFQSERGIDVVVAADQSVVSIKIDGQDRRDLVDIINKALKEAQKKAQKKMMEMGSLGDILGGLR